MLWAHGANRQTGKGMAKAGIAVGVPHQKNRSCACPAKKCKVSKRNLRSRLSLVLTTSDSLGST